MPPTVSDDQGGTERDGRVLLRELYTELRKLAEARMRRQRPGQTLQPTALVHEAYLRLMGSTEPSWDGRAHFFGAAARAMRDILVEHARRKLAQKRGGDQVRVEQTVTLVDGQDSLALSAEELLALHDALERMQAKHPEAAEIVILRYFGGLTMEEIAAANGKATRTIERKWKFARAWLHNELSQS